VIINDNEFHTFQAGCGERAEKGLPKRVSTSEEPTGRGNIDIAAAIANQWQYHCADGH